MTRHLPPRLTIASDTRSPFLAESTDNAWMVEALCAQTDPEIFFPDRGGSTRSAKKVCARCPVRDECLEYALEHGERHGIWGGKSERERRKLEGRRLGSNRKVDPAVLVAAYRAHTDLTAQDVASLYGVSARTVARAIRAAA